MNVIASILFCPRCGQEWKRRVISIAEHERLQAIADRCRWLNQGYFDGPGTLADIELRLANYERFTRFYTRSEQHLKERIKELEHELADVRAEASHS